VTILGLTYATPSFMKSCVFAENWAVVSGMRIQRYANTGHQVARATKFCSVAPNIFGSSVWNLRDRGGTVVKVLCYKSEGRWFDPS